MFNANYVTYFDNTMTELWRAALGSYQAMVDGGTDMVVAEVGVRYRRPAGFDEELEVAAEVTRLGNTGMTTRFTVHRAADAAALAEGEVRHVFVDPASKAKKPIPAQVRRALEPYAAAAAGPPA